MNMERLIASTKSVMAWGSIFLAVAAVTIIYRHNRPTTSELDTDASSTFTRTIRDCRRDNGFKSGCLRQAADTLVQSNDPAKALSILSDLLPALGFFPGCHELAHYIGQAGYRKYGSVDKAFAAGSYLCYGAYYHGVIEGLFSERSRGDTTANESLDALLVSACSDAKNTTPALYTECLHGTGHGLMFATDMDVPQALSFCDSYESSQEQEACYGGVFMENSTSTTQIGHVSPWLRPDDPSYPCTVLDARYRASCYRYQGTYVALQTVGNERNWDSVLSFCNTIPDNFRHDCFFTIGTNQPSASEDPVRMYGVCSQSSVKLFRQACVRGVVASLVGWHEGQAEWAKRFCAAVSSEDASICYRQIGSSILAWTGSEDETDRLCEGIGGKEHSSWCREGKYLEDKNE